MRSTLSKFFLVPVIAAVAAMAGHTAQAQTVNVPFTFNAHGQTFPAGTYSVEKDVNSNFVSLRTKDRRNVVTKVLGPGSAELGDSRIVLRFAMAGDDHVLESIQYGPKVTSRMTEIEGQRHETVSRPLRGQ
jgi:hypothetical protein